MTNHMITGTVLQMYQLYRKSGQLLGHRTTVNSFPSYVRLGRYFSFLSYSRYHPVFGDWLGILSWPKLLRCLFTATVAHKAAFFLAPYSWGFEATHDAPQSVGFPWTRGQLVTETSPWQHTQHSKQTNIHAPPPPGGIRTRDPSRRTAADLRLRPSGLWDRQGRCFDCTGRTSSNDVGRVIMIAIGEDRHAIFRDLLSNLFFLNGLK